MVMGRKYNEKEELALEETDAPDPLRMFGILVPLPLRESKKSFSSALNEVIEVLNARNCLQQLEEKVNKLQDNNAHSMEAESQSNTHEENNRISAEAPSNKE